MKLQCHIQPKQQKQSWVVVQRGAECAESKPPQYKNRLLGRLVAWVSTATRLLQVLGTGEGAPLLLSIWCILSIAFSPLWPFKEVPEAMILLCHRQLETQKPSSHSRHTSVTSYLCPRPLRCKGCVSSDRPQKTGTGLPHRPSHAHLTMTLSGH